MDASLIAVVQHPLPWHIDAVGGRPPHRLPYGRSDVAFTFIGADEMDEVRGSGSAELLEDGTLEIELDFDHGDDAILRAEREGSSATC
jgi:hypothetical protein